MSEPGPSVPPEPKPSPEVEMGIERLDKLIDLLLQIEYSASQDPYTEEAHAQLETSLLESTRLMAEMSTSTAFDSLYVPTEVLGQIDNGGSTVDYVDGLTKFVEQKNDHLRGKHTMLAKYRDELLPVLNKGLPSVTQQYNTPVPKHPDDVKLPPPSEPVAPVPPAKKQTKLRLVLPPKK
eukprot:TRINITY_DN18479_c0_g1_i1.p1 TRINITY_DN18479_c0_g1~~TRINITY_DN18479_c0_g1_i1.p1  ORF type:complete len:179 (-),score=34.04 TRINITY_DN18479_c0_g1_i1:27-563(-)